MKVTIKSWTTDNGAASILLDLEDDRTLSLHIVETQPESGETPEPVVVVRGHGHSPIARVAVTTRRVALDWESFRPSQMTAEEVTRRLYDAADDYQATVLDALRDEAGITWTCPISPWTNMGEEDCDECGLTKAEAFLAEKMLEDYE